MHLSIYWLVCFILYFNSQVRVLWSFHVTNFEIVTNILLSSVTKKNDLNPVKVFCSFQLILFFGTIFSIRNTVADETESRHQSNYRMSLNKICYKFHIIALSHLSCQFLQCSTNKTKALRTHSKLYRELFQLRVATPNCSLNHGFKCCSVTCGGFSVALLPGWNMLYTYNMVTMLRLMWS